MRYWIFLIVITFLCSCNGQNINALKHEKLKFEDLPFEVAHYLVNPNEYHEDMLYMLVELPKGVKNNYRMEIVKTMIGPWESHKKLINVKNEIFYKIDQDVPRPFIVFENNLYVSDRYNIFTTVDNIKSLEFTRYELK